MCVVFLFHPSDARTCGMANCQYGCEVLKGEVRCQCPSPGLQLAADGRTCVGRFLPPTPPGMTSEPNVTVPSREQLVQNTRKNVVFNLVFTVFGLSETRKTNLWVKTQFGRHKTKQNFLSLFTFSNKPLL